MVRVIVSLGFIYVFHYFGYGSNLNMTSLRAKGVEPLSSEPATLHGWTLRFNVRHWFRHEGGVGNIQPSSKNTDKVLGMVYRCSDEQLPRLDTLESYGVGYDRVEVDLQTASGSIRAFAYVGLDYFLDDDCLPTRRYINILVKGAIDAGLDAAYIDRLNQHPLHPDTDYPPFQHPGAEQKVFCAGTLAQHAVYTAVGGAVFDMQGARPELDHLKDFFGGRDMTLFFLKRLDTSDGTETIDDIAHGRISAAGLKYLNAYLNEYNTEYRYIGRYEYR